MTSPAARGGSVHTEAKARNAARIAAQNADKRTCEECDVERRVAGQLGRLGMLKGEKGRAA